MTYLYSVLQGRGVVYDVFIFCFTDYSVRQRGRSVVYDELPSMEGVSQHHKIREQMLISTDAFHLP